MVALAVSVALLVGGIALCLAIGRRRPPGAPFTWGEAFVTSTFVFGLMLLAYGVVPNEWLKFADDDLLWRSDKILGKVAFFGRGQVTISYRHRSLPVRRLSGRKFCAPGRRRPPGTCSSPRRGRSRRSGSAA